MQATSYVPHEAVALLPIPEGALDSAIFLSPYRERPPPWSGLNLQSKGSWSAPDLGHSTKNQLRTGNRVAIQKHSEGFRSCLMCLGPGRKVNFTFRQITFGVVIVGALCTCIMFTCQQALFGPQHPPPVHSVVREGI